MNLTKENLNDLKWHGRVRMGRSISDNCDIAITPLQTGYTFTFKNNCWKKMATNGACSRVEFAFINDDTIILKTSSTGYKLTRAGYAENTKLFRFEASVSMPDVMAKLKKFVGEYTLRYEPHFKLWYISKID